MRLLTHTAALLAGAALAAGAVAVASPSASPATGPNLFKQVAQLQKDDARLKFTVGNLCVWFKHAPTSIQLPNDQTLAAWLYNVGLGCDTFGLH
jgi:hypothetical protein